MSVFTLVCSTAAPLRAAPPPATASVPTTSGVPTLADSLTGLAKAEYDSGRILFDNGDYKGALVKFQHAYDLSSDPRLLWNMGACEKQLRHYVKLLRLMDRYLHDAGTTITDAQRADAQTVSRTVKELVSTLRITVNVAGATVFVDDESVGTTPLMEPLLVDLGDRQVRVTKPGYKSKVVTLHVAGASEVPVAVSLEKAPAKGMLTVVAQPKSALIHLDGAQVGTGRWQGAVAPGTHALRVSASDMVERSTTVAIRDGESRTIDIALEKDSGGSSAVWWIGAGVLATAGLAVGGYYLFRSPEQTVGAPTPGTISPYSITLPGR